MWLMVNIMWLLLNCSELNIKQNYDITYIDLETFESVRTLLSQEIQIGIVKMKIVFTLLVLFVIFLFS